MSSHGTLPSITTDAPGLIPRTFLFLQHRDSHPGLPRMQTDKAMVINFSFSQTRKPDGEAIIPGTFHIDIPGWGQKLWVPTSILGAGLWTTTALGMMTQYISILAPSVANAKYYAQTFRTGLHCEGLKQASYTGYFKRLYYWWQSNWKYAEVNSAEKYFARALFTTSQKGVNKIFDRIWETPHKNLTVVIILESIYP